MKRISKRTMLVTMAVALLTLTVAVSKRASTAVVRAGSEAREEGSRLTRSEAPAPTVAAPKPQVGQPEFKSSLRVAIHPEEIYPLVATVRPGKVILTAENYTLKDVVLVVEAVSNPGHGVARVPAPVQDKKNRQEYTLAAGEYVFYEESRPKRQGKLIVDPKLR